MARITFEIREEQHKIFKAAVARDGLQMSDVLRGFVGSYNLTERNVTAAQITELVVAARDTLRALDYAAVRGNIDSEHNTFLRTALAPFETEKAME